MTEVGDELEFKTGYFIGRPQFVPIPSNPIFWSLAISLVFGSAASVVRTILIVQALPGVTRWDRPMGAVTFDEETGKCAIEATGIRRLMWAVTTAGWCRRRGRRPLLRQT